MMPSVEFKVISSVNGDRVEAFSYGGGNGYAELIPAIQVETRLEALEIVYRAVLALMEEEQVRHGRGRVCSLHKCAPCCVCNRLYPGE